ncbi:MAG: nitroreductase family deazaflavin-dependent oxidoreductase [Acidimicrobiales bacterium]
MAPWLAYRLGLGWLLGHRVVLLEHRGRTTGRPVRTALRVVRWDPASRHLLVAAGAGPGTDWYRNVLAHPLVRVTIGRERNVLGCAVPLAHDEARSELERSRARRPTFAGRVVRPLWPGFRCGSQPTHEGPAVVIDLAPPRRRIHRSHRSRRRPLAA